MRRWNPKRRSRWLERAGIALAAIAALFFGGRYVLWNWWPLAHLQHIEKLSRTGLTAERLLGWAKSAIGYRTRKMFDYANARLEAISKETYADTSGLNGRYFDDRMDMAAYVQGREFVMSHEPRDGGIGDYLLDTRPPLS